MPWQPQEPKPATPPAARPSSAGVLKVTLVEGKELLAVDKGGTSDPFAVLQLLDQYDNPHGKPQKSKPIKKTLAPQWKQSFQFPLPATVVGFKLRVVVQDQDRGLFGAKPATNLGTAYLSMAMLAPGTVQDNWFKLERVGDMQRVSGAVRVAWARYAVGDDRGAKKGRKSSLDHLVDVDGKETPAEEAIDEAVDDDDLSEAGVAKREADAFDAAYSTGSATGTFETTPGMGAKFCAAAWDSRRTFVVSPSTVLNLTLAGRGSRAVRRYVQQLPLQVLGFASLWIASPHGEPRRDRDWLPLCGGALSGDDWTKDRGELDVEIRVLGPADPARLAVKRPWSRHVPPTPPFAIDAPALRELPPDLKKGALVPLVFPTTFRTLGRTSTPAANYRRALSLLPLHGGDARDDATKKRRLIEQHFIRAAGHNVAKRLIRGGAGRESQLPPPGKRRFDGSGFVYPADTPDPRRPPATYPDTLASLCRTAAGIRTRDFYVTGDPTLLPPNVLL